MKIFDRNPLEEFDKIMEKTFIKDVKSLYQAELITGIKSDNLRQRIHRGTLKARKIGRDWFISNTEIKRLLES